MEGKLVPIEKAVQPVGDLYQRNLTSIPGYDSSDGNGREAKLWEVSKGFEAMFMTQMYKAMRNTVHESELTKPSRGRKIFTEFLDAEYAKMASGKSSEGLAGVIYRYLVQNHNGPVPRLPTFGTISDSAVPSSPYLNYSVKKSALSEESLTPIISEASEKYGIDINLIKSVIQQESAYQPYARSKAGAKGLMQLMDSTASDMGVYNVFDPKQNILGGVKYLKYLNDRYRGDEKLVLAAYNAGPSQVDKYRGIPPFPETQNYVNNVLAFKKKLELSYEGVNHDH